ncbi:membrane protein DedA with SNARE-associated domain [Prauserella isguenensis]|uniref:Membrane protein DedA with SNARE-associated domain n=1 Tax=Prauserella isguenensis TaxID=1470180 RepID=A0A839S2S0_9PSEU|nr:membrane protein DedA with SNARE-associated domain [Prauserella isguenensis]
MVTDLLNWLQSLPQPALVGATGLLVLLECTIGLGFLAPGESGLLIAATTATTVPRFLVLWIVVTICAGIGDSIGYTIGRRFGPKLRETKLIQKYGVDAWDKATGILQRRGAWAVFFARFFPVVRTLTPAASGTSGLPFHKFLPAAVAGATCWSALHIALGAALGEAAKQVEDAMSTGGMIVVAVFAAVAVFALLRFKRKKAMAAMPSATDGDDPADTTTTGAVEGRTSPAGDVTAPATGPESNERPSTPPG